MKFLNWALFTTCLLSGAAFADPVQTLSCDYSASIISNQHKVVDHEAFSLSTNETPGGFSFFRLKPVNERQVSATFVVVSDGNGIYSLTLGIHELSNRDELAFSAPPATRLGSFTLSDGSGVKDVVYEVDCKLNP